MRASYIDLCLLAVFIITLIAGYLKKFDKKALMSDFIFGVRVVFAYIGAVITYYIIQSNSVVDKGISVLISHINGYIISPSFTAYILTVVIYGVSILIIYLILNIFLTIFRRAYLFNKLNNLETKKIIKHNKRSGLSGVILNIPTGIAYALIIASLFILLAEKGFINVTGQSAFITHALNGFESVQVDSNSNPFHEYIFGKDNNLISANSTEGTSADKEHVIVYYNGVTLADAVKSDPAIDAKAKQITSRDTNDIEKARSIYNWVGENIKYDDAKAEEIVKNQGKGVASGAIEAFNTREGVCFDYASLYAAMAKDVGLKVRIISGEGYTGSSWGPHAWNEVYIPSENKWIPVDPTFASSGDYFATSDFYATHKDGKIIGQWS
ncbi:MAG: transglutaminase-like domain-containing protein [Sarcina sp.]